jgi:hypothetical protein
MFSRQIDAGEYLIGSRAGAEGVGLKHGLLLLRGWAERRAK